MPNIGRTAVVAGLAVLWAAAAEAEQAAQAPLPETDGPVIEYSSVAAALSGLHARTDVVFSTQKGWIIATDEAHYTIWSFAPAGYPAYPAVVKRQIVSDGTGSSIITNVECEASKEACDDLVRTFSDMTAAAVPN